MTGIFKLLISIYICKLAGSTVHTRGALAYTHGVFVAHDYIATTSRLSGIVRYLEHVLSEGHFRGSLLDIYAGLRKPTTGKRSQKQSGAYER